ncbi:MULTISPECIES: hypothetical protein [Actinoplanes]|uniref:hypothetical protein n=1 Tax=Actinoplanes TaxID=1865 RepID=UPI0005F28548|nr:MULTISPECIES: hypothetical protein [Actinoplanes]GLY02720.1 hypothetical protein Acsp01_30990 [Actinoplanes sp. NBRC 101535]
MTVTLSPVHTGDTPIATCHWQGIANIVAASGMPDAERMMCPSWGARWKGDGVLYGGGRWPILVADLFAVRVGQYSFAASSDSDRCEQNELAAGRPVVAEIDAYFVPSPYHRTEHVVHTVVVLSRSPVGATILDTTNNPVPVTVAPADYRLMRDHPCVGRVEPRKIYTVDHGTPRMPTPVQVLTAVSRDMAAQADADLRHLAVFLDWAEHTSDPVNVCRVAAERHAAARLFEALADAGVEAAVPVSAALRDLAQQWYTTHVLTTHPRAGEFRHRQRTLRLLRALTERERDLHGLLRDVVTR